MMMLVIWTLTKEELATTKYDKEKSDFDKAKTSPYDDILNKLNVDRPKKL
jgi:hypothetical protein